MRSFHTRRSRQYLFSTAGTALVVLAASCGGGDGGSILESGQSATTAPAAATTPPVPGDTSSDGGGTTAVTGSTAIPPTTAAPTTTAAPLAELPPCPVDALETADSTVELTFWHAMTNELERELVALTDTYNASQSRVRVQLENQIGYEQSLDKYLQSSQGSRPDIMQAPEYAVQVLRDTDSMVPMQACIEASGYDLEPFLDRAVRQYSTEGIQWSMPFNVSNPVLYYNKKVFSTAGLDPDRPPESLEDLRSTAAQIVSSGAAAFGLAVDTGADSGGGWFLEQWFAKLGEYYSDNQNGRAAPSTQVLYNSQVGVDLLTFVQALVQDGLAVNVGENASSQDTLLKMGDPDQPAAMAVATSGGLGAVLTVLGSGAIAGFTVDDLGVGPMPGPGGAPGVIVGGASLWVVADKGDEKTAAAWDYISYLVSAASQSAWAAATGYVPVRSDALELDPVRSTYETDPRFQVAYDQLLAMAESPSSIGPILGPQREVRVTTARAVAAVLQGAEVAPALDDAARRSNALIADYAARN